MTGGTKNRKKKNPWVADGGNFTAYANLHAKIPTDPKTGDFNRTLQQIEIWVQQHGPIAVLRIYDHGSTGNQVVGPTNLSDILANANFRARLNESLADDSTIELYGCHTCADDQLSVEIFNNLP
jgi:Domain of unknown function (DUF4347)